MAGRLRGGVQVHDKKVSSQKSPGPWGVSAQERILFPRISSAFNT